MIMSGIGENRQDFRKSSFEEEYLQKYLEGVTDILQISSSERCIEFGSKEGENFNGIIYRVLIKGHKHGIPIELPIICKVPPKEQINRYGYYMPNFFSREHLFYLEIVPEFNELLQARGKRLEDIPECYFSSSIDNKEGIFLEDLKLKGFVMSKGAEQMDFGHAALAFRALGRFHALSFALRDQKLDTFRNKITVLEEPLFTSELLSNSMFIAFLEEIKKLIGVELSKLGPKYSEKFSLFTKTILSHMKSSCDGNIAEPYAVLCHGDYWKNNFLFKYEKDSAIPCDIKILDFQLVRHASPVLDICYMLYYSGDQKLSIKHFDELLKIYHQSLSAYLVELGSDPEKLFPYDALLNQLEKFGVHIAGLLMLILYLFLTEGDNVRDFSSGKIDESWMKEKMFRHHFWSQNLIPIFKDLIDRNFI